MGSRIDVASMARACLWKQLLRYSTGNDQASLLKAKHACSGFQGTTEAILDYLELNPIAKWRVEFVLPPKSLI